MTEQSWSILPGNRTPFEKAFAEAVNHRMDGIPSELRRSKDLTNMPDAFVPFLAYEWAAMIWDDNWPIEVQKGFIRALYEIHRKTGTEWAIRRIAQIVGAEIKQIIVPPDKAFPGRQMTEKERRDFMRLYPELRVYSYRNRSNIGFGIAPAIGFVGGHRFMIPSTAKLRYGRQAYLFRDGVEIPLKTVTETIEVNQRLAIDYDEVRQPGKALGSFVSRLPQRFMVPSTAAKRIFRIQLAQPYEDVVRDYKMTTVKPGLGPLGYDPEKVAAAGVRKGGTFVGDKLSRLFLRPSTAGDRLYDRLYLFDPAIPVARRQKSFYMNTSRLGMPAYTARIRAKITGKRPINISGRFCMGFVYASPKDKITKLHEAIRAVSSLRDRILVTTKTVEPITASPTLIAGQVVAGQLKEIY